VKLRLGRSFVGSPEVGGGDMAEMKIDSGCARVFELSEPAEKFAVD